MTWTLIGQIAEGVLAALGAIVVIATVLVGLFELWMHYTDK